MQSDMGKLFIGGISWDTTEERLNEYFGSYGELLETVIMKDRSTGRARGFGFVVFADSLVAERVSKEKHNIDGRLVEAKRAIPRDDNISVLSRTSSSIKDSPSPFRTKKIFVGGLASTVTETDFKSYFEKFGTITDAVVMYDHNTRRPRGFGFITYDSEDSVDKVLLKTFHELNGKMVEVKRAVPKELSPSPSRSPLSVCNYEVNKINDLLNGYNQEGYSLNSLEGYGLRVDGRFSPIIGSRNAYQMGKAAYIGLPHTPNFGGGSNFSGSINYGHGENPYYIGNSNRVENYMDYGNGSGGDTSFFSSGTHNLWGNERVNYGNNSTNSSVYMGSSGNNSGVNWGSIPTSPLRGASNIYKGGYGQNVRPIGPQSASYAQSNSGYDRAFSEVYGGGSVYGDAMWHLVNSEGSGSFGFGLGSGVSDVPAETSRFLGDFDLVRDR